MLKRVTSLMVAMICAFTFIFICPIEFKAEADSYFVGSGTREDPYQISSKNDLKKLAELCNAADANTEYKIAYYIQTTDIDLDDEAWTPIGVHWNASTSWEGHRCFGGVYDGKGHTISGLNVSGGYAYAGLFGRIGTDLQADCRVENIIVKGNVEPVADSTWTGGAGFIGGISGEIGESATVSNCSFIGMVSGLNTKGLVGGLVGKIYLNANIYNSSFIGDLKNKADDSVAGIIGSALSGEPTISKIVNCYACGKIDTSGGSYGGGISGQTGDDSSGSTIDLINCYYSSGLYETSTQMNCSVTTNKTYSLSETDMKIKMADLLGESFVNDNNNINNGYPIHIYEGHSLKGLGTKENPYQISSKADLFYMSDAVNARIGYDQYYIQTANIDLENDVFIPIGTYTEFNRGWGPCLGFEGCYDGNCKTIYNLNIKRTGEKQTYSGLFGWMYGLAGESYIKNIAVYGNIECMDGHNIGGIVGEVGSHTVSIINCSFTGNISGSKEMGGIIGATWHGMVNVTGCYFNGEIRGCLHKIKSVVKESVN